MRKWTVFLTMVLAAALGVLAGAAPMPPAKKDPAGFARIKSLAGEWEGKTSDGKTVRLSYRVASAGSAVVESLKPPDEMEMVTVYHADGDSILMTHFCAANNQPRMRARSASDSPKELAFSYVDAANLAGPEEGHMSALTLTFEDANHLSETWTWTAPGGGKSEVFRFERKK
jgi:hypothetical protein